MTYVAFLIVLPVCALVLRGDDKPGTPSKLWGKSGEAWTPQSRLPDFSFAGYHRGEAPLPNVKVAGSVKGFGAVGDGKHDDTEAFKKAIATVRGAIEVPPGKYVINDILEIKTSNVVLRGAGPAKTTLYFPRFLQDLRPNMGQTTTGQPTSNYSWSGGFIWVRGSFQSSELATVTAPAKRGDVVITVSSADELKVGQSIEIQQRDEPDNSLCTHLYAGQPDKMDSIKGRTHASLTTSIVSISKNRVTIDRALRFDIEARWKPRVLRFEPKVTEVGIEGLRFEFPVIPYKGHFTELGHNPIAFSEVADCWVKDIVIDHCDSGIFASGRFCTFDGIVYNSSRPVDKSLQCTGHHGVYVGGDDNLFTRFRFNTRFIHDISVSHCAGNVFSAGSGVDLCFDHHKRTPYANLFSMIDLGAGTRMWRCGGGAALGRHSAAWETFWNIRATKPQSWPPKAFGPDMMNLVGVQSKDPADVSAEGKWFEPIAPESLTPQDLHAAQLERRLKAMGRK